jgi:hypothetical protein
MTRPAGIQPVSRFRSSQEIAARAAANFGIKGTLTSEIMPEPL